MAEEDPRKEPLPYPKSVFFILSNEFCERFCYYGMRAVLTLYLNQVLLYNEDESTILYHGFSFLCYFFPLVGAIIADSFWGKFKTILYLSILYAVGNVVLAFASATIYVPSPRLWTMIGLGLIAIGTGGIKPCVSAFGGDQFKLPEQEKQQAQFFSVFYFAINAGSLLSTFFTPILRQDFTCLSHDTCYPLAFGVPAVLMIGSVCIFIIGKPFYIMQRPGANIIADVLKCVPCALRNKFFKSDSRNRSHWLDHADDKFSQKLINDIKSLFRILYLFIPVPFFWALFDQQASRWTFQATVMDGEVNSWFTIKPDQMQIWNPLLILVFIPLFEMFLYPALKVVGIRRPLQKISLGGFLAAFAFLVSAYLEYHLEPSYAILPTDTTGQLRIYNGFDCELKLDPPLMNKDTVAPFGSLEWINAPVTQDGEKFSETVSFNYDSPNCSISRGSFAPWKGTVSLVKGQSVSYVLQVSNSNKAVLLSQLSDYDDLTKSLSAKAKIKIIYGGLAGKITLQSTDQHLYSQQLKLDEVNTKTFEVISGSYTVLLDEKSIASNLELKTGGVYYLDLQTNGDKINSKLYTITNPATLHMVWLLPQIVIITAAEILFSITGLEFSYSQAPKSMKSLISSAWLLTVAFGNIFVVIISEAKFFERRVYEFLLYTILMTIDMVLFVLMALGYKYRSAEDDAIDNSEKKEVDNPAYVD